MAYGSVNADLMTTSDGVSSSGLYGFKNRIINGAMVIDQRNAGASITVSAGSTSYPVDRMLCYVETGSSGTFTAQQSSTAPTGFVNSVIFTTATADSSISASEGYTVQHRIEGYNVADLGFGTANAKTVTLSFWVRSSLTGTFSGSLTNGSFNRSYIFDYTISSANTWTQISVTIAGDTSGTWNTTNGSGLIVYWNIGAGSNFVKTANAWGGLGWASSGSTNLIATNGATLYITGVQLEKGSTATSFDYRPYGTELQLCQRYLPAFTAISGTTGPLPGIATALTTNVNLIFNHPVPARVPGTGVTVSSNSHFTFSNNDGNSASTAVSFAAGSPNATQLAITVASSRGLVTTPGWFYANNASAILYITGCEL